MRRFLNCSLSSRCCSFNNTSISRNSLPSGVSNSPVVGMTALSSLFGCTAVSRRTFSYRNTISSTFSTTMTHQRFDWSSQVRWMCTSKEEKISATVTTQPNAPKSSQFGMCALHGKKRHVQSMNEVEPGVWHCIGGNECKPINRHVAPLPRSAASSNFKTEKCALHGKPRNLMCLNEVEPGVWHCKPDSACKEKVRKLHGAGDGTAVAAVADSKEYEMCSTHGKRRSTSNMIEYLPGVWKCKHTAPCTAETKTVTCSVHGSLRNVYHMDEVTEEVWKCRPETECRVRTTAHRPQRVLCSVHGKSRSQNSMNETSPNVWSCKSGLECRSSSTTNEPRTCSVHGKKRTASNLVETSPNVWSCKPGHECRDGGRAVETEKASALHVCSVHGKVRTRNNLMETMSGVWQCKSGSECKGAKQSNDKVNANENDGKLNVKLSSKKDSNQTPISVPARRMCSRHGKMRSMSVLSEVSAGLFECTKDSPCVTTVKSDDDGFVF